MQKEAAWLLAELKGLVARGVLDEAAAERVRAHYSQAAGEPRLGWGMILLATGGAALIGLGIILIFAHNWESWTPGLRAALSLLPLLVGQAACVLALRRNSRALSEAAALFTAIAIGASIALIAQTYQFGGDLPRFLMTWLLLAAPLIYLLDASAAASGCWLLVLAWVTSTEHSGWWAQEGAWQDALRLPIFLALFSLPLPHLMRHIRLDRAGARVAWMLRCAIVVFAIGLAFAAGNRDDEALLIIYGSAAAVATLAGARYFSGINGLWGNPLQSAGLFGVFTVSLLVTVETVLKFADLPTASFMTLPVAFGAVALWLAWLAFRDGDRWVAPLLGAFMPLLFVLPLLGSGAPAILLAHAYVLALAGAFIRAGLGTAQLTMANFGAALLCALVLLRFFDSDLSYVVRGVGFIVTGVGFFMALFWLRSRVRGAGA
jgi:uncharacterized membrane protein